MGPVIVLVIVVLGLTWGANVAMRSRLEAQGYRPAATPPTAHPEHSFDESTSASFRGGSRVGRANTTAPLVRLRADEDWIHLAGTSLTFGLPPQVWVERGAVDRVLSIGGRLGPGIRFEAGDGRYDSVIFWTFDPGSVLGALQERGWPVSDDDAATAPD